MELSGAGYIEPVRRGCLFSLPELRLITQELGGSSMFVQGSLSTRFPLCVLVRILVYVVIPAILAFLTVHVFKHTAKQEVRIRCKLMTDAVLFAQNLVSFAVK